MPIFPVPTQPFDPMGPDIDFSVDSCGELILTVLDSEASNMFVTNVVFKPVD